MIVSGPPAVYPWPIGAGPRYHPPALRRDGRPVRELRCASGRTIAVHLELFAKKRVVVVPRGIGVAKSCTYPVATTEPTGVLHVRGRRTLGDLFAVWGTRLGTNRLLSFPGRVSVYVGGRPSTGDPRSVPLHRHAEIVVEVDGHVAPHPSYLFPKGVG